MRFLFALLAGLLCAGIFYGAAAATALVIAALISVPSFEGENATLALFIAGPIGAFIGLLYGIGLVLRFAGGHKRLGAVLGRATLALMVITLLVSAGLGYLYLSDDQLGSEGSLPPQLEFEIRLPSDAKVTDPEVVRVDLRTDRNVMPALMLEDGTRHDGARVVLRGIVELYYRTAQRTLVLHMQGEPDRLFQLRIPANPLYSDSFGPWYRADFLADPAPAQQREARPDDEFQMRYRVPDPALPHGEGEP